MISSRLFLLETTFAELSAKQSPIDRVTISCLFLRFFLISKDSVLENVNVLIYKKLLVFESRAYF